MWTQLRNLYYALSNPRAATLLSGISTPIPDISVTRETVLGYPAVWAAVNLISQTVAKLKPYPYKRIDDTGRKLDRRHQAYPLLANKASRYVSASNFRLDMTALALIHGNAYAWVRRNSLGEPEELVILDPRSSYFDQMTGVYRSTVYTDQQPNTVQILPENVIHIRGLGGDGINGYPVVSILADALSNSLALQKTSVYSFGNSMHPSGVIETPNTITKNVDELNQLHESIEKKYAGLSKAGKLMLLQGGLSYKPVTFNAEEMQFLQSREFDLRTIALIFGLGGCVHKLASSVNSSYGSIEAASLEFLDAIDFWLCQWETELSDKLLTERQKDNDSHYIEFNREALIRMDMLNKVNAIVTQRNNGLLNTDEARALLNLSPLPDELGETYYLPANLVPMGQENADPQTIDPDQDSTPLELQQQLDATAGQGGKEDDLTKVVMSETQETTPDE